MLLVLDNEINKDHQRVSKIRPYVNQPRNCVTYNACTS